MNALSKPWDFQLRDGAVEPALAIGAVEVRGAVATWRMDRPAPCRWDAHEQRLFADVLGDLDAREDVDAIVLHGKDLFDEGLGESRCAFRVVIDAVADCRTPVVAAVEGDAVGAGLELALACAARVATPNSRFSLPDLAAGRLPSHGAVERLPRLVGMGMAAEVIVLGRILDGPAAAASGLIDLLDGRDQPAAARGLAEQLSRRPAGRPCLDAEAAATDLFRLRLQLRRQAPDQTVPLVALQALEAAVRLPMRRAMAETARLADSLLRSDQAQRLAYADAGKAALSAWGPARRVMDLARQLRWPLLREAVHLLDEGATPGQIDRCLTAFGFAEGPFAESDRLGLDAVFLNGPTPGSPGPWLSYSPTLDLMVDAQRLGGAAPGWFRKDDAGAGPRTFDPVVAQLLQGSATFQRLSRHPIADESVAERCLLAAINGAAEILQDRTDLTSAMLDAVWTTTLGFPAWKGGPLYCADQMGLDRVVDGLGALLARRNTTGEPCEMIRRRALRGEGLA
jgi:enoyl-CoA hydratase/carnithine racemase